MDDIMRNEKDILGRPELRKNPYTVPDGYFNSVKKSIRITDHSVCSRRHGTWPYILAIAASFALLFLAGAGVLSRQQDMVEYDSIDLLVFSDISEESYYDLQAMSEPEELSEEEIIEYLIYTGTTLESIETNE